jgi:hypothetical protein
MADNLADDFRGAATGTASANASPTTVTQEQIQDTVSSASGSSSTSNGNLPWAVVLLPTTAAGHSGIGQNKHGLVEESWVFGFFADGDNCQQPVIAGVIPRGQNTNNMGNAPQNSPPTSTTGADSGTSDSGSTSNSKLPFANMSQAIQIGYETLMRPPTNFTKEQVSGILGNLIIESGLNPNSTAKNDSRSSRIHPDSIGIAQWNDLRAVGLKNYAASKGKEWTDLQTQYEYIGFELLNSEAYAGSKLKNSHDPVTATDSFCLFERPKGYSGTYGCERVPSLKARRAKAQEIYEQLNTLQKNPTRGAGVAGER